MKPSCLKKSIKIVKSMIKSPLTVRIRVVNESTTDPEIGVFHKGEHRQCFAYSAHTVCEQNNFVLEVTVTPGNVHDSQTFDALYQRVTTRYPTIRVITANAGYKTPWIAKQIFEDGRIPSLPCKRPMTNKGFYPRYEYVYDAYNDWIICPNHQTLYDSTTNRKGYQIYKSISFTCEQCPEEKRRRCMESKTFKKTVNRHIGEDYLEQAQDVRHSPLGKTSYALRSQTTTRVFADAKEKHAMRYTLYRGLKAVTNWVRLKVATMNLKKLALWKAKASCSFFFFVSLYKKNPDFSF